MTKKAIAVVLTLACWLICLTGGLYAGPDSKMDPEKQKKIMGKAEEWVRSADNREWAASACEAQLDELILQGQAIREKACANDSEKRRNFVQAGDLEKRAGDQAARASANFDQSVINWDKALGEIRKLSDEERTKQLELLLDAARDNSLRMCTKAAEVYERAALSFGKSYGNDAAKEADASEKAAQFREKLAGRQN